MDGRRPMRVENTAWRAVALTGSTTCFMAPGLTLPGPGEEIAPLQVRFEDRTKKKNKQIKNNFF